MRKKTSRSASCIGASDGLVISAENHAISLFSFCIIHISLLSRASIARRWFLKRSEISGNIVTGITRARVDFSNVSGTFTGFFEVPKIISARVVHPNSQNDDDGSG